MKSLFRFKHLFVLILFSFLCVMIFGACPTPVEEEEVVITPDEEDPDMVLVEGAEVPAGVVWQSTASLPVTITSFMIDKYELTYDKWYNVLLWALAHEYTFISYGQEGSWAASGAAPSTNGDQRKPVTKLSYMDAIVWCNAYSEAKSKTPVYKDSVGNVVRDANAGEAIRDTAANGYRLATADEWEFAARGGEPGEGLPWAGKYGGSDNLEEVAYADTNDGAGVIRVGGKAANPLGLYDMAGNAWEYIEGGAIRSPNYFLMTHPEWGFEDIFNITYLSGQAPPHSYTDICQWNDTTLRIVCVP